MKTKQLFHILSLFILVFAFSCKKKLTNTTELNFSNSEQSEQNEMKHTLPSNCLILDTVSIPEKQSIMQYIKEYKEEIENQKGTSTDIIYEEAEVYRIFPIVDIWLRSQGFKHITDDKFKSKVKLIFNIDISKSNNEIEANENYILYKSDIYKEPYGPHLGYTYFVKSRNYIFRPTLDEYFAQKTEGGQYYTCFKLNLLHQNQFLFNDNFGSLTWLINNDMEFLEMLIKDFGYDKNEKLNQAVLDKINKKYLSKQPSDENVLIDVFAKKDCNGNLQIREGLMKFVSNNYDKQFGTPINMLDNYAIIMSIFDSEDYPSITSSFSRQERMKIAAYAGYYEELARYKNYTEENWTPGSFLRNSLDEELLKEIEKNNYYGLPNYKEMVETVLNQIEEDSAEWERTHN